MREGCLLAAMLAEGRDVYARSWDGAGASRPSADESSNLLVRLQDLEDARERGGAGPPPCASIGARWASRVVGIQGRRPAAARSPLGQRKRRFRGASVDRREPSPRHSRSISRSGGAPKARGARRRTSRREPRNRHVVGGNGDARRFERGPHGAVAGRGRSAAIARFSMRVGARCTAKSGRRGCGWRAPSSPSGSSICTPDRWKRRIDVEWSAERSRVLAVERLAFNRLVLDERPAGSAADERAAALACQQGAGCRNRDVRGGRALRATRAKDRVRGATSA